MVTKPKTKQPKGKKVLIDDTSQTPDAMYNLFFDKKGNVRGPKPQNTKTGKAKQRTRKK
jgi:hypothetical protein